MPDPRDSRRENGPTVLALFALIFAAVGLIGLTGLILPQILGFVVVVGGFIVFGMLQYLVWGRWLPRDPVDDDDEHAE